MPRTTTEALYDDLLLAKYHVDREEGKPLQDTITADARLDGTLVRDVVGRKIIDDRAFYGVNDFVISGCKYCTIPTRWMQILQDSYTNLILSYSVFIRNRTKLKTAYIKFGLTVFAFLVVSVALKR